MGDLLTALEAAGLSLDGRGRLTLKPGALPVRPSRVKLPFTEEDDRFQTQWMTLAAAQDIPTNRLHIFQDLERINPRHTSSSWQAHWKELRDRPGQQHLMFPPLDFSAAAKNPIHPSRLLATTRHAPDALDQIDRDIASPAADDYQPREPSESQAPSAQEAILDGRVANQLQSPGRAPGRFDVSNRIDEDSVSTASFKSCPQEFLTTEDPHAQQEGSGPTLSASSIVDRRTVAGPPASQIPPSQEETPRDDSLAPPNRLRRPQQTGPRRRDTPKRQRFDSEVTVRVALDVQDRQEMLQWLSQGWVIDVYEELAQTLEHDQGLSIERPFRHHQSSRRFVIHRASRALRTRTERYVNEGVDRSDFSQYDHEVRFVARLVDSGRAPRRWWSNEDNLESLCDISYRVMAWLQHIHRITVSTAHTSQWGRAAAFWWLSRLERARNLRRERSKSLEAVAVGESDSTGAIPSQPPARSVTANDAEQIATARLAEAEAVDSPDSDSEDAVYPFSAVNHPSSSDIEGPTDQLPGVPRYPVKRSKTIPGQIQGFSWLMTSTKLHFQMRQTQRLADWGVNDRFEEACIMVPRTWSGLDPMILLEETVPIVPPPEPQRLMFSFSDHRTTWVRAATWFADETWSQRSGVDLDNFLGYGRYMPMEGSHLCHEGDCIVSKHAVYEDAATNARRKRCSYLAREMRQSGQVVPRTCKKHEPPCLMQLAALTRQERLLIQVAILRQARGLGASTIPSMPSDHEYPTFEHSLPLTFVADSSPVDADHLVEDGVGTSSVGLQNPIFYCRFCPRVRSYQTLIGYWSHVRDKHDFVSTDLRLQEIKRSGALWRDHLRSSRGDDVEDDHNSTLVKIGQLSQPAFSWETVMSWKLRYSHEQ